MLRPKQFKIAKEARALFETGKFPNEILEYVSSPDQRKQITDYVFFGDKKDAPKLPHNKSLLVKTKNSFENFMSYYSRLMGVAWLMLFLAILITCLSLSGWVPNSGHSITLLFNSSALLILSYHKKWFIENLEISGVLFVGIALLSFLIFWIPNYQIIPSESGIHSLINGYGVENRMLARVNFYLQFIPIVYIITHLFLILIFVMLTRKRKEFLIHKENFENHFFISEL